MKKTTSEKILLEKIDTLQNYISKLEWDFDFIYVLFKRLLKFATHMHYNQSKEYFTIYWNSISVDIFHYLHGSRLYYACLDEFEERNKQNEIDH